MVGPRIHDSRSWSNLPETGSSGGTPIKPVLDGDGKIFVSIPSYRGTLSCSLCDADVWLADTAPTMMAAVAGHYYDLTPFPIFF